MASVKVAVRVRPFNQRETDMQSCSIIRMDGQKTAIVNPKLESNPNDESINGDNLKEFTFDYSYWSFDPYDTGFASQEQVYKDLGADVVTDAFEGYNCCIFAYGQTGSGKTYTMMGTPDSEGLIPRICQQLFAKMKTSRDSSATYRTEVSYLEIYNETVKDLLSKNCLKQNLRVREHPKLGPYVQDLSKHLVQDYSDLQELMNRGNAHRTTAATKMNDTSSRSHAIFTIGFSMASFSSNTPRETLSKINLVDLAGSERATTTKAEGQRLIEGGHINKSLVTLGSVISALADKSSNHKKKQCHIPYRDSVLTWLLKDSLGGNSKTIMIAAVSPADCNYGETLSTLRYANRAKNIINKPTINEDSNTKLIRELRSEIERLQSMVKINDCPNALERVAQNEEKVRLLTEEWTEKWKETHKILREQTTLGLRRSGFGIVLDSDLPHLVGIDDDVLSTGITLYHLKEGKTTIGTDFADIKPDIVLHNGEEVEDEHCYIELKEGVATLVPLKSSICFVNAIRIEKPLRLTQGCIIVLGQNMFRFNDPKEVERLRNDKEKNSSSVNLSKILSRSSDFSKSFESLDLSEMDSMGNEICEKRKQIKDLENEYKLAEEKRRIELLAADKQIEEKHLELERLKTESERLSQIINESQLIIQKNDSVLNNSLKSRVETESISDMLSSMKDKTEDAKQRVSDVLSTITTNVVNRNDSLIGKSVLLNIYETLSQQIDKMGNEFNDCSVNENKNFNFIKNNIYDKIDNNLSADLTHNSYDAQNINENNSHSKYFNSTDFENRNYLSELSIRNDLNPIQQNIEKVLFVTNESIQTDCSDSQPLSHKNCDLNRNFEENQFESRLFEMKAQFESQLTDLQKQFECQRMSFDEQRGKEMEKLENERKLLQELEESKLKLKILVEREVQKKLQQMAFDNSLRNDFIDTFITSSPKYPVSPLSPTSRSVHSIPSLTDILENSSESLVQTKQVINSNIDSNKISINISRYVLRGLSSNAHHEYEIQIDVSGDRWTIYRRYRRFRELHQSLVHKYGQRVDSIYFPPKIYFDYRNESVAKERKRSLESYLKELIAVCQTIRNCPLNYKAFGQKLLTKECLEEFSPFFLKDCFDIKHIMP